MDFQKLMVILGILLGIFLSTFGIYSKVKNDKSWGTLLAVIGGMITIVLGAMYWLFM